MNLFGDSILDAHVEKTKEYMDLPTVDATVLQEKQKELKSKALKKFFALMFLKQSDQQRYGRLLKEFRQSYANSQRDIYPEDLTSMFEVMRTVKVKKPAKKKGNGSNSNNEN